MRGIHRVLKFTAKNSYLIVPTACAIVIFGCGGGQSGATNETGVHTLAEPGAAIAYIGKTVPIMPYSVGGISIATMAGASFTNVTLIPPQALANTLLTGEFGDQVWTAQPFGQSPMSMITQGVLLPQNPSFSHNGLIAFSGTPPGAKVSQIYLCNYDGSGLVKLTNSQVQHLEPSWNYQDTNLVFHDDTGKMYTVNAAGTGETALSGVSGYHPEFSPDGSKIAYSASKNGHMQVFTSPSAGGGTPRVISTGYSAYDCTNPSWSPDGTEISFGFVGQGSGGIAILSSNGSGAGYIARSSYEYNPAFSPDGSEIAYDEPAGYVYTTGTTTGSTADTGTATATVTSGTTGTGTTATGTTGTTTATTGTGTTTTGTTATTTDTTGATTGTVGTTGTPTNGTGTVSTSGGINISVAPVAANAQETVVASLGYNPVLTDQANPAWSPFAARKPFIGTLGMVPSASGFIWAQYGDAFASFAAVVATTPALCSITLQSGAGSNGSAIYLAQADALTKLVYANAYFGSPRTLTLTGSNQILITVSGTSGQISTVAAFASVRQTPAKPALRGTHLVYNAKFTALFSREGKNVAPNGASEIEVDSKTGELVSWR